MKNYLFAPFKDDKEKIAEFEHLNRTWNFSGDLIVFIGQLESYYDVIISELKADNDGLLEESNLLKAENYHDEIKDLHKERDDLFKENKRLKAENESLKEQVEDLMIDLAQAIKLRDKFGVERDDNRKNIDILKTQVKEKERQYHMLASSKPRTFAKDYKKEADEYFNHNPQCKGVRFHMIDFNDYDYDNNEGLNGLSGEYKGSLFAEDCLIEIDNSKGGE
jgi:chromosome segregation ATPase